MNTSDSALGAPNVSRAKLVVTVTCEPALVEQGGVVEIRVLMDGPLADEEVLLEIARDDGDLILARPLTGGETLAVTIDIASEQYSPGTYLAVVTIRSHHIHAWDSLHVLPAGANVQLEILKTATAHQEQASEYLQQADNWGASDHLRESAQCYERIHSPESAASVWHELSDVYRRCNQYPEATECIQRALALLSNETEHDATDYLREQLRILGIQAAEPTHVTEAPQSVFADAAVLADILFDFQDGNTTRVRQDAAKRALLQSFDRGDRVIASPAVVLELATTAIGVVHEAHREPKSASIPAWHTMSVASQAKIARRLLPEIRDTFLPLLRRLDYDDSSLATVFDLFCRVYISSPIDGPAAFALSEAELAGAEVFYTTDSELHAHLKTGILNVRVVDLSTLTTGQLRENHSKLVAFDAGAITHIIEQTRNQPLHQIAKLALLYGGEQSRPYSTHIGIVRLLTALVRNLYDRAATDAGSTSSMTVTLVRRQFSDRNWQDLKRKERDRVVREVIPTLQQIINAAFAKIALPAGNLTSIFTKFVNIIGHTTLPSSRAFTLAEAVAADANTMYTSDAGLIAAVKHLPYARKTQLINPITLPTNDDTPEVDLAAPIVVPERLGTTLSAIQNSNNDSPP